MYQSTTNTLTWSGGGHHPSVVLVPGQPDRIVLTSEGPMMGVLRKAEFPAQSIQIPPETRLLIFSDGVFPLLAIWIFLLMCQSRRVTSSYREHHTRKLSIGYAFWSKTRNHRLRFGCRALQLYLEL